MKIVVAPQSFKGSLSALRAAQAMEEGITKVLPRAQTDLVPVADGGDGTLEALIDSSQGQLLTSEVTGPLGERVTAQWGAMGDGQTAVIEMAQAAGLVLVPLDRRNPLIATTYGVGELISRALDKGFRRFIVGIGGSATNDGGAGMAQALGARLLDREGRELTFGGGALARLGQIDLSSLDSRLTECRFLVACDVINTLTGPEGASAVYGPQKGATPDMVSQMDEALGHYANIIRRDLGLDTERISGAGAAGGLGGGLVAFLRAELRSGVDMVLDAVKLEEHLQGADLVITGEGRLDGQTAYSKAPVGVARRAKRLGIPTIAIAGSLGEGYEEVHKEGIDVALAITSSPMALEEVMHQAYELLANATEEAIRLLVLGGRMARAD